MGDDFMMTSGGGVNPLCRNLRGYLYTEPGAKLSIGNRVGMSSTAIWCSQSITIGNDVSVGANCIIIDTDSHPIDWRLRSLHPKTPEETKRVAEAIKSAPIVIEDNVWIGANCLVLKGVTIGARSVIGAGSVVTKSIPADCIAAGNPARVIKSL